MKLLIVGCSVVAMSISIGISSAVASTPRATSAKTCTLAHFGKKTYCFYTGRTCTRAQNAFYGDYGFKCATRRRDHWYLRTLGSWEIPNKVVTSGKTVAPDGKPPGGGTAPTGMFG
ncbi:MAG: hypothetical protein WCI34_06745 [Actinomycetes bacterium]